MWNFQAHTGRSGAWPRASTPSRPSAEPGSWTQAAAAVSGGHPKTAPTAACFRYDSASGPGPNDRNDRRRRYRRPELQAHQRSYDGVHRHDAREEPRRPAHSAPFRCRAVSARRPQFLLQHWRGQDIDWDAIVERCVQTRTCCECHAERPKVAFTAGQWNLMCKTKRQCSACEQWHGESAFTAHGWRVKRDRVCAGCRIKLAFRTISLRSRRRLQRRVEKTREQQRKRVLEEVCREIERRRSAGRFTCGRCGVETTASDHGSSKKARRENGVHLCCACRRLAGTRECEAQASTSAARRPSAFTYRCPACSAAVATAIRDGCVDNRHACGHQFNVSEGQVGTTPAATTQRYSNECPLCKAKVESSTRNGRIDNRHNCGHQLKIGVAAGLVVATPAATGQSYSYECPQCKAKIESSTRDGRIDNRHKCGHQFSVAAGPVVATPAATAQRYTYKCPQCKAKGESTTRDGRIDNRHKCGHQFRVAAGRVVPTPAATARSYTYNCPQCKAKVESTTRDGRIDSRHKCGHQFRVAAGRVVPTPAATARSYTYNCPQ